MLIILLSYIVLILVSVIICSRNKKYQKWLSFILTILIVIIPFLIFTFLFISKDKIQRGEMFPKLSAFMLIIAPPEHLYDPIATYSLTSEKALYTFNVTHQYAGNYAIVIRIPPLKPLNNIQHSLKAELNIYPKQDNQKFTFHMEDPYTIWTEDWSELKIFQYTIPNNIIKVGEPYIFTIKLEGNRREFLKRYKDAIILIRKGSDI